MSAGACRAEPQRYGHAPGDTDRSGGLGAGEGPSVHRSDAGMLAAMDPSRGNGGSPGTPWWYRVPPVAVVLIVYAVTGIIIFTTVSESASAWAGGCPYDFGQGVFGVGGW